MIVHGGLLVILKLVLILAASTIPGTWMVEHWGENGNSKIGHTLLVRGTNQQRAIAAGTKNSFRSSSHEISQADLPLRQRPINYTLRAEFGKIRKGHTLPFCDTPMSTANSVPRLDSTGADKYFAGAMFPA
ncbi:hypothetical protein HZH68_005868 [Vespula germanica]|uniref:Uncharacterized protein n=2 Tax=Vespula TaxID=7451 RepID=A0A834KKK0_VESGE|nr:hypothetical protein HZH68_005868 [Vespula germanica]KAF7430047.1 hypothetical protein H0235_006445 [Vespula pensylvanica]